MKFNLKQAFSYLYNDAELTKKLLILYPLAIFAILSYCFGVLLYGLNSGGFEKLINHTNIFAAFGIIFILTIAINCLYSGYFAINTNLRIHKPESKLPELKNWKGYFTNGLKIFAGFFVWQIIVQFVVFAMAVALVILGIVFTILLKLCFQNIGIPDTKFFIAVAIILIIFAFVLGIIFGLFELAAYTSYLTNLDFDSFFDFKKIKKILFKNFKPFMKFFGFMILFKVLYCILFALFSVTIVGILFLPILQTYCSIIISDIQAQFIRHSFNIN